jgi:hypothetical protein
MSFEDWNRLSLIWKVGRCDAPRSCEESQHIDQLEVSDGVANYTD